MVEVLIPLSGHPSLTFDYGVENPFTSYVSGVANDFTVPGAGGGGSSPTYTYPVEGTGAFRSVFPAFTYNGSESGIKIVTIQFAGQFTFNGGNNAADFSVPGMNAISISSTVWSNITSFINASFPSFPTTQTGNSFTSTITANGQPVNTSYAASYAPQAATNTGGGEEGGDPIDSGSSNVAQEGTPLNTRFFTVQLLNGGQYNEAPFAPIEDANTVWKAGSYDVTIDLDDYPALDQSTLGRNGPIIHQITLTPVGGAGSINLLAAPVKSNTWYLTASNTFLGSSTSLFEFLNTIIAGINAGNAQVRAEQIGDGSNNFKFVSVGNVDLSVVTITWDVEGRWSLLDEQNTLGVGTVFSNSNGARRTYTQNYNIEGRFEGTGLLQPLQRDKQQIGDDIFAVSDEACAVIEPITDIILEDKTTTLLRIRRDQAEIKSIYQKFRGRIINVPDEFDPVARIYTGVPDFNNITFKQAYSNDPAWCFYDYLTDVNFGAGQFILLSDEQTAQLLQKLYLISLRNNEVINNSYRNTINGVIAGEKTKIEVLEDLAASMFSRPIFYNGVTLVSDIPSPTKAIFNTANVLFEPGKEAFSYTGSNTQTNLNEVTVRYQDEKRITLKNSVTIKANNDPYTYGTTVVESPIGVNNKSQAERYGRTLLFNNAFTDVLTVTFETGAIGNMLFVGDIIAIPETSFDRNIELTVAIERDYQSSDLVETCTSSVWNIEISGYKVDVNSPAAFIGQIEFFEVPCDPVIVVNDIQLNNTQVDANDAGVVIGNVDIKTGLINGS